MKKTRIGAVAVLCLILIGGIAVVAGCGSSKPVSTKPQINSVSPTSGPANTQVVVSGEQFGPAKGLGEVHFGVQVAQIVSWSDTQITTKVPTTIQPAAQPVSVINDKGVSNEFMFTVTGTPPAPGPDQKPGEIEHITPADAMLNWMKKDGMSTSGWSFSVVKTSASDPNWKIDSAAKSGQKTIYFLLHKDNGKDWVVKDEGAALTPEELKADGAPADLWAATPAPAPPGELTAVQNYIKSKDQTANPAAWSLVVTKESKIDPNWEVVRGTKPGEGTMYFIVHYENGAWVVKDASTAPKAGAVPGEPSDIP